MAKLECATKSATEWFHYNGMQLNSSKCHLLVCGHKFESMIFKIENSMIVETHLVKLLGVHMESELTFAKQMEVICKKSFSKTQRTFSIMCLDSIPSAKDANECFF